MSVVGHNLPKIMRCFHRYGADERMMLAQHSSRSNGNEKKLAAGGEFYWWRDDMPSVAFASRKQALYAGEQP